MRLQAFIDESGDKGQSGYLTLAGVLAEARDWAAFSTEWKRRLAAPPSIPYLSTSDARGFRSAFRSLNRAQRDAKVSFLTSITRDFADFRLIACSIDLDAYTDLRVDPPLPRTRRERALLKALATHPYLLACTVIALVAWADISQRGLAEEFELILDEKKNLGWKVEAWWPLFRYALDGGQRRIIPARPRFGDDINWMPLQLADFIAHTWNAEEMQKPHPFVPALRRMPFTQRPASWYRFDRARLQRFFGVVGGDRGGLGVNAELTALAANILAGSYQ